MFATETTINKISNEVDVSSYSQLYSFQQLKNPDNKQSQWLGFPPKMTYLAKIYFDVAISKYSSLLVNLKLEL